MRKYITLLTLLFLITACSPTPRKVKEAVGKGEIKKAVTLLVKIINEGEITDPQLDHLLNKISDSHNHFKVNKQGEIKIADNLLLRISSIENKRRVLSWYVDQYLLHAEGSLQLPPKGFNMARKIWRHYQKQRKQYFPEIKDSTPVLAVIDLREAEYLARKRKYKEARKLYEHARVQLTEKRSFDRLKTHDFKDLAISVEKELNREKKK